LDGISGAALGVLFPMVIADIARGTRHYSLALGIAGLSIGLGAAISTTVAGYVTDIFSEHTAFLMLASAGGAGFLGLALLMPETLPGGGSAGLPVLSTQGTITQPRRS
jgi:MFS family permease